LATAEDKFSKKRLRSSYFTVIVSISLVLFMLGLLGFVLLNANRLSNHVKENIGFSIIIKEDIKEVDIFKLQKSLVAAKFTKSTDYIDKEKAAAEMQEELGEDFISFLGYNPLLPSLDVKLNAQYANSDSLAWIKESLSANPKIKEINYQESLIADVNKNIRKISMVILAFSGLLLIIAISLINNSIRLAIYSKRFLIKTMQLVGATSSFIRRPFVWKSIMNGVYGAIIASALLIGVVYYSQQLMPELFEIQDLELLVSLVGIVLLFGIVITWISTALAVSRYLRMKTDKMY
jgi:cell division transport system permease protein|tara:strand:- start:2256 stop:3131 length:876 start_codon:yes stop_codon:yes gene_type:complete